MNSINKKGISLIVLVITIIVMIILAGAVVITLASTGIIDRASEATHASDLANVKTLADVAWADAYASGARTRNEIKAIMEERLRGTNLENYLIKVTPDGVIVNTVTKNGGIVVEPYLNEHGFYYDYPYAVRMYTQSSADSAITGLGVIFHEDGSCELGILSAMANNLYIAFPLELIDGGEGITMKFEYSDHRADLWIIDKETGEKQLNSSIGFTEDGLKIDMGEEADIPLDLTCEFGKVSEVYRDVEYRGIGIAAVNSGTLMDMRATISSDDILTYENKTTGEKQSIKVKLVGRRFLVAADQEGEMEDISDLLSGMIGIVTLDGEHLIMPFEEGLDELGNMVILKKVTD